MQNVLFCIKIAVTVCSFCLPAFVDKCIFGKVLHPSNCKNPQNSIDCIFHSPGKEPVQR